MQQPDVLIVGAGPTGLTAALELCLQGIPFRIVDKAPEPTDKSKALVLQARSLELLNRHGLGDEFIAAGNTAEGASVMVNGEEAASIDIGDFASTMTDSAHPLPVIVDQCETEGILRNCLKNKYGVEPEWGVAVSDIKQDSTGVSITLENSSQPSSKQDLRVKYVVGADGAHSVVRHSAPNMTFEGAPYPQDFILCDAHIRTKHSPNRFYICLGQGLLVIFPLKGGKIRLVCSRAGHVEEDQPKLSDFQEFLDIMMPGWGEIYDPIWTTRYRLHHRGVNQYREGRLLVAGDAAHIHSPAGGQGMNTGIQDAINLGWKLSLVLRGERPDSFLDSYNDERHPVGRHLLDTTDRLFTWMTWDNPVYMYLRNTLVPWFAPHMASSKEAQAGRYRFMSQFGIRYRKSPITGTATGFTGPVMGGNRAPDGKVSEKKYLLGLLSADRHNLLLFSGVESHVFASHEQLQEVKEKFLAKVPKGDKVDVHIVYSTSAKSSSSNEWIDVAENQLHTSYGMTEKAGYAYIRPDMYVAHIGHLDGMEELYETLGKS